MGIFALVQTIWATDLPVLGQISDMWVSGGATPVLSIHDPATQQRSSLDLGAGLLDPASARTVTAGQNRVTLTLEGRARSLDAETLADLGSGDASTLAYLDGVGFAGNLAALHRATIAGQPYLYAAAAHGAGLTAYRIAANGTLSPVQTLTDSSSRYLSGVTAMDSIDTGSHRYLLTASMTENGLSVFEIAADGRLTHTGSFGFAEQLPVDRPSAMQTVSLGGRDYVLLAAYGSSSLSVLEVRSDGSLALVDQVNDSLDTRFDNVAAMDVVTVAGQVLVAAAGTDGGVSLFQMLPDGYLVHRETIVDGIGSALDGVRQLDFAVTDGRVELFVLSSREAGMTRLALDLGSPGTTGQGVAGTAGNDVLTATPAGGQLHGQAGSDILIDGAGMDTLWGGSGADIFVFRADANADTIADFNIAEDRIDLSGFGLLYTVGDLSVTPISGGTRLAWGDETLTVLSSDGATLRAADLADRLLFNSDHVIVPDPPPPPPPPPPPDPGTPGDDTFTWTANADTVDGGAGFDMMSYAAAPSRTEVYLDNQSRNAQAALGDVLINIEAVTGTRGNDRISGDDGNNTLIGLKGKDRLIGGNGDDWITPGAGADTVDGGAGTDTVSFVDLTGGVSANLATGLATSGGETNSLVSIENATGTIFGDFIQGDAGNNRIRGLGDYDWLVGSGGADYFDGGNGRDMVSYVYAESGVTVNLGTGHGSAGQAAGDRYVNIERVTGSTHGDLIYGSDGEDDFRGLGGYDWFVGSGGGKDRYDGGAGQDTVAYSASAAGVVASLLLGRGSAGDAARDLYTSIESLTGTSFDDILTGDNGRNVLRGLYGADRLYGNGGVDRLTGGGSDDYLDGGSGWDYAIFSGAMGDYSVTTSGTQTIVDTIAAGGDGTDTLVNIEALQFADGFIFL